MTAIQVLAVASEIYPLVKTGGLEPKENTGSWISKAFKGIGLG